MPAKTHEPSKGVTRERGAVMNHDASRSQYSASAEKIATTRTGTATNKAMPSHSGSSRVKSTPSE